jgi:hypothetical protein
MRSPRDSGSAPAESPGASSGGRLLRQVEGPSQAPASRAVFHHQVNVRSVPEHGKLPLDQSDKRIGHPTLCHGHVGYDVTEASTVGRVQWPFSRQCPNQVDEGLGWLRCQVEHGGEVSNPCESEREGSVRSDHPGERRLDRGAEILDGQEGEQQRDVSWHPLTRRRIVPATHGRHGRPQVWHGHHEGAS